MQKALASFSSSAYLAKVCVIGLLLIALPSCARDRYRRAANRDTNHILHEKSSQRPWYLPGGYTVNPDTRSRLFDPSNPNDPLLPLPGPHLYSYELPQLTEKPDKDPELPDSQEEPKPENENSTLDDGEVRLVSAEADSDSNSKKAQKTENSAAELTQNERLEALAIFASRHSPVGTKIRFQAQSTPKPYEDAEEGLTIQPIP